MFCGENIRAQSRPEFVEVNQQLGGHAPRLYAIRKPTASFRMLQSPRDAPYPQRRFHRRNRPQR
jgi:hypothetical protein